jgi:hypothetical protein
MTPLDAQKKMFIDARQRNHDRIILKQKQYVLFFN